MSLELASITFREICGDLTPEFCCERSCFHAETCWRIQLMSSHSTAMLRALGSSNATLGGRHAVNYVMIGGVAL